MTIEQKLTEIERLNDLKQDYLNMFDLGIASFNDYEIIENCNAEIQSLKTQLEYEIEYFQEETVHGYILGYKRYNGYRIVNTYIRTLYAGRIIYTLDYAHAKVYTTKQAATHAYNRMIQYHNNNLGDLQ